MIIIADAGPLLHLHWVEASEWALPPLPIQVVREVWQEVAVHAADALGDPRLHLVSSPAEVPQALTQWNLDAGERAALTLALSYRCQGEVLILCDERTARRACSALELSVTGSIGLIVEAYRSHRVSAEMAIRALRELPHRGRLHVDAPLVEKAIAAIDEI